MFFEGFCDFIVGYDISKPHFWKHRFISFRDPSKAGDYQDITQDHKSMLEKCALLKASLNEN
jgi:hypothetical protein